MLRRRRRKIKRRRRRRRKRRRRRRIRNRKRRRRRPTAAISVAEVGKPPDVAEPDGEAEAGQEELHGVVPAAAGLIARGHLGVLAVGEGVGPR
jgi:hypothetical protein